MSVKVGVVVPDRGDRPEFMATCRRLIGRQTLPHFLYVVQYGPMNDACDIVPRYRDGYNYFSTMGDVDIIAFMENDDWYSAHYLEFMLRAWEAHDRPDMFGTNYTIYYHLKLKKFFTMRHAQRSNTMNMLIKPGLKFQWPKDHDPFIDSWLWLKDDIANPPFIKKLWEPPAVLSIGMKHGIGKLGARHHVDELSRYINDDSEENWLRGTVDEESYQFYSTLFPR